ncbi:GTPase [Alicyclobacillus acidocaldarius]|nr:GTPase [Alicyclobacillus acidocaldarius]
MSDVVVVGRANAGKTSACLRLARALGVEDLVWMVERTDGVREKRRLPIREAERWLTSGEPHSTTALQTLTIPVARGKVSRSVDIVDSAGLAEGHARDERVRRAMGQTLRALISAKAVLHVVDAADVGRALEARETPFHALDEQLVAIGRTKAFYLVLASKIDLPLAERGVAWLRERLRDARVIATSAKTGAGFDEVKRYVWKLA